ncbi:predicted metal-sulfur cluster biosynthetic enzyme (plasmid) [Methylobacterium aquaticum]|uniref:Predicted metal-sulfur cluster biosynthetic enzyme n=2 Tax=Methylobacteriaceae TaxID=119045 RepID=A0A0C6FQA0_9HYPH|nr:predicted metal-sulfur cluster biosynthetic enzyme [Methylobacterium aquaticum]
MWDWLRARATRQVRDDGGRQDDPMHDPEVTDCLLDVLDPEVGVSVVHLGLVYRAMRSPGRIEVDLTLTTRACPLGGMLVEEVRTCLRRRFNDRSTIAVRLVWSPLWGPERITEVGWSQLGGRGTETGARHA